MNNKEEREKIEGKKDKAVRAKEEAEKYGWERTAAFFHGSLIAWEEALAIMDSCEWGGDNEPRNFWRGEK